MVPYPDRDTSGSEVDRVGEESEQKAPVTEEGQPGVGHGVKAKVHFYLPSQAVRGP